LAIARILAGLESRMEDDRVQQNVTLRDRPVVSQII